MAIRIGTKKLRIDGTLCREITKISGVATKEQLPPEYLQLHRYIYAVPNGLKIHTDKFEDIITIGKILSEGSFVTLIKLIQIAGNNLHRINKGLPPIEEWKGRETFVI